MGRPMLDLNTALRMDANGKLIPGSWVCPPSGYKSEPTGPDLNRERPDVAFLDAMAEHGLNPGTVVPGSLQRFDIEKKGDKAGWYVFFDDNNCPAGAYGDWQTGLKCSWSTKDRSKMTATEREQYQRHMVEAKRLREAAELKKWEAAIDRLEPTFTAAGPANPEHPYLKRKGVKPKGDIRQAGELLLAPLTDIYGRFWNYQEIYPEKRQFHPGGKPRDKNFPSGGRKKGCFFSIPGVGDPIICEGVATGLTINMATERPVFCAMDAGNMPRVAKELKEKFPTARIGVAADNDRAKEAEGKGNAGRKYGDEAAKILGTKAVYPVFDGPPSKDESDFNDMARVKGLDAVKDRLGGGIGDGGYLKQALFTAADFRQIKVPPKTYHLFPWLWAGSYGVISGERGIGKTWFAMGIVDAVTKGAGFGPWRCEKPTACLYIEGEMPLTDDQERIDLMGLARGRKKPLFILSDAYVCEVLKRPSINIGCEETRQYLRDLILSQGIGLVVLDNVASLTPGMDENSKMEWDPVNQWLIGLRYAGVSPYLIHHLGKNGDQRGTSGREDNIDISIKLTKPRNYRSTDGARFIVGFPKKRVSHSHLPLIADLEMQYRPDRNGDHVWTYGGPTKDMLMSVLQALASGITQAEAAKTLGVSQGQISKFKNSLVEDGFLTPKNVLTKDGEAALIDAGFDT